MNMSEIASSSSQHQRISEDDPGYNALELPQQTTGLRVPSVKSDKSAKGSKRSSPRSRIETPLDEKKTWYEGMYPTYKTRNREFRDLFKLESKFVVDFACAYNKDFLRQGRMYLSTQHCCFYSNIFGLETNIKIDWKNVTKISKEKTAYLIPNAIQIHTEELQYFFATFHNRDATYAIMLRLFQSIQRNQPMTEEDVGQIIMCQYPEEDCQDGSSCQEQILETVESSCSKITAEELSEDIRSMVTTWNDSTKGDLVLDRTIDKPLSQVYTLLYTNSNFYFTFQKDRGSTELDISDWEQNENGTSSREVAYNMKMNNPVGPKTCQVKEFQLLQKGSIPDKLYCIDTEAFNSGVPYADAFTVKTHISAYSETSSSCKLIVRAEINFRKELWSYLKGKIETNAWNGIRSYYQDLGKALQAHREDDVGVAEPVKCRPKSMRSKQESVSFQETFAENKSSSLGSIFTAIVIAILCLTCLVNIMVIFNIRNIEPITEDVVPVPRLSPELLALLPESDQDWVRLLRAQAAQHNQVAQEISGALRQVATALSDSEKTLRRVGRLLKNEEMKEDFQTIIENLSKNKIARKTDL